MRIRESLYAGVVLALAACGGNGSSTSDGQAGAKFDPSKSDPRAVKIADEVMTALGGAQNWGQARYLSFRFVVDDEGRELVSRKHDWDRWTGRYRLEDTDQAGHHSVVFFDVNSKEGTAYVDGTYLEGDTLQKTITKAYARYINDTYWLLMPYKMKDPGVVLSYEGTVDIDGYVHDVVHLSFDHVGLTPDDVYWAYIDQASRLMTKWEYILKGGSGPRTEAWWKGWKQYGAIKLADVREFENTKRRILFRDITVSTQVDEGVFASPAAGD
jgi:hypothetical protein